MIDIKNKLRSKPGFLFSIGVVFVLFFELLRVVFMLYYHSFGEGASLFEYLISMWYGLRLDLVVTGYLLVIPFLAVICLYTKIPNAWITRFLKYYFVAFSIIVTIICVVDLGLYGYWRFRLDATPLFYLRQPKEALDSAPLWMMIVAVVLMALLSWLLSLILIKCVRRYFPDNKPINCSAHRIMGSVGTLFLGGVIFLMIRGGLSVATANVAMVYHSSNQFMNHCSINPVFSFLYSVSRSNDLMKGYEFYKDQEELAKWYKPLHQETIADTDPSQCDSILHNRRPNIVLVMMESFSANAVSCLSGPKGITPNIDAISKEGILFDHTIANSFRTDRGMVSILSAFPGQPTSSIMKYPEKAATLPSIAQSLKREGYSTYFLYGGDANFTNTKAYMSSTGYEHIIDLAQFDKKYRLTKWGVPDAITFDYMGREVEKLSKSKKPFLYTFMTLSSHEPFDVPTKKYDNPYLNSVHYVDQCVGKFISELKRTEAWHNTLVIFMADHGFLYPESATQEKISRYQILHMWCGGALSKSAKIGKLFNQVDLAATLLSQMGIDHSDFEYSKNVLSSQVNPFAVYSSPNLIGLIDSTGVTTYDCDSKRVTYNEKGGKEDRLAKVKAYFQTLMNDMDTREKRFINHGKRAF